MPEANIQHAISRELLNPEDRAKPWSVIQACYAFWLSEPAMHALAPLDRARPWAVIQACYASWLSESAMKWLIENGLLQTISADAVLAIGWTHMRKWHLVRNA